MTRCRRAPEPAGPNRAAPVDRRAHVEPDTFQGVGAWS